MSSEVESSSESILSRKNSEYKSAVAKWRKIAQTDGLTASGNSALLQSLDGYHDAPYDVVGLPTGNNERIVVHDIQRSLTITKPSALAAGASWDCHIVTNNVFGGTDGFVGFGAFPSGSLPINGIAYRVGNAMSIYPGNGVEYAPCPIVISRVPSGTDTFGTNNVSTDQLGVVDIPKSFLTGQCRVIGMSFEVVNATAPLYTSGQAGVYRLPSNMTSRTMEVSDGLPSGTKAFDATGAAVGALATNVACVTPMTANMMTCPPADLNLASKSHNWTTWHAKEGCYVNAVLEALPELDVPVGQFNAWALSTPSAADLSVDTFHCMRSGYVLDSAGSVGGQRYVMSSSETTSNSVTAASAVSAYQFNPMFPKTVVTKFSRSGCYFTGLNENSVLQLKVRFIVERVPSVLEESVYSLARLAPSYDPHFWEMYSRIVQRLPPGCMQTENPLGEWFNTLTDAVKRWAPVVGSTVGNFIPGAAAVGHLVGKAAGVANKFNRGDKESLAKKDKKVEARHSQKKSPPVSSSK